MSDKIRMNSSGLFNQCLTSSLAKQSKHDWVRQSTKLDHEAVSASLNPMSSPIDVFVE